MTRERWAMQVTAVAAAATLMSACGGGGDRAQRTGATVPAAVARAELLVGDSAVPAVLTGGDTSALELVRGDGRHRVIFPGAIAGRWSPDGRLVARLAYGTYETGYGGYDFEVISSRVDGGARRVLRFPARHGAPFSAESMSWLPDAGRVLVSAAVADGEEPPRAEFVAGRDGHGLRAVHLRCSPRGLDAPTGASVSPDGRHIAYWCHEGILIARGDGSHPRPLPDPPPRELSLNPEHALHWRPDSRQLAATLWGESQVPEVRLVAVGAGGPAPGRRIAGASDLSWSPDGRYYAYATSEGPRQGITLADAVSGRTLRHIALKEPSTVDWRP